VFHLDRCEFLQLASFWPLWVSLFHSILIALFKFPHAAHFLSFDSSWVSSCRLIPFHFDRFHFAHFLSFRFISIDLICSFRFILFISFWEIWFVLRS
jgi:hypothetical protein